MHAVQEGRQHRGACRVYAQEGNVLVQSKDVALMLQLLDHSKIVEVLALWFSFCFGG